MSGMRTGICTLLLSALPGVAVAGDDFGRLFTTAAERAQLDAARMAVPADALPAVAVVPQNTQSAEPDAALTVRGLVKRGPGRSTAWVNDSNTYEGDLDSPYRTVDKSGIAADQVTVKLPDGQSSVKMKVGQTFDPASAQIRDLGAEPDSVTVSAPANEDHAE